MKYKKGRRHAGFYTSDVLYLVLFVFLLAFCMTGCGGGKHSPEKTESGKLRVVTTIFPYYDFLRQVGGDRIELTMVLPAGMDSHSFEPTPADVITIQSADLLVCNGGEMEHWLERVLDSLKGADESPGRVITMMDYVEVRQEEIMEGMEAESHDHSEHESDEKKFINSGGSDLEHSGYYEDGHEIEIEYDEHIWTSPVNAMELVTVLAEALCEEDPENAVFYKENASKYLEQLKTLDHEIRDVVKTGKTKLIVFGDKFPLRYFFDEYGLSYRAAFTGCSTDTEPSAKTIAYLIDKVREADLLAVYYLELSSHRVAEIIGEETKAEPLLFHSCHNVTRKEFDSGVTYLELMKKNVANIRKGLN